MKTLLPIKITTVEEAKSFLAELHKNGEHFHPEDDATAINWEVERGIVSYGEACLLNCLMRDIYALPGNDGRHVNLAFDPCTFLLELDARDNVITVDGSKTTLGEFLDANDEETIAPYREDIVILHVGETLLFPAHCGQTVIERIS